MPFRSPSAILRCLALPGTVNTETETASIEAAADDPELFVLELSGTASLVDALAALMQAGVEVLSCREVRSELEEAFVQLTGRR